MYSLVKSSIRSLFQGEDLHGSFLFTSQYHIPTQEDNSMLAIFIEGKSEPIYAKRLSIDKKGAVHIEEENGKTQKLAPQTIKNVVSVHVPMSA